MHVDPYAWIVTLPLIGFLLWAHRLPAEHVIKQLHRRIADHDAVALSFVGIDPDSLRRFDRLLFRGFLTLLVVGTALSAATCAGLIG